MATEKNVNTEKKRNKLAAWFLGLPKWGKILLVGGLTAGVATAITVPTVLALTKSAPEVEITKEDAFKMSDGFIYKNGDDTDTKDCANKFNTASMDWDCNENGYIGAEFINLVEMCHPYSTLKNKTEDEIKKMYKGSLTINDRDGFRNFLSTSSGQGAAMAKQLYVTKKGLEQYVEKGTKFYKKGSDLVIGMEQNGESGDFGYVKFYYSSKGLMTKFVVDVTMAETDEGTAILKANASIKW